MLDKEKHNLQDNNGGLNTPPNYFNKLNRGLLDLTHNEVLDLNTQDSFSVPTNYFNNLNKQILSKTAHKKENKIVKLLQFKWQAAAAVLCIAGSLFLYNFLVNKPVYNKQMLSKISDDAIISHLANQGYNVYLLCDAGWCNDLAEKETSSLDKYILDNLDETLLIEEL